MIAAVVFDVGGVLCPSPVGEFAKVDAEYGLPDGTTMSFFRGGDAFARCETGQLAVADFFDLCATGIRESHGVELPPARLDAMLWACMGESVSTEMRDLVLELKAGSYRTGLLTNIFAERRQWLHSIFPVGTIDVFADSSELGLRKPEPRIYERLLELLDLPADRVAFVDDFPENLGPARDLGMTAVLFEDPAQVRGELIGAGVEMPARPIVGGLPG